MNTRNSVIGFIGLGAMGSRMAQRLVAAGFKVLVFDRIRDRVKVLAAQGAALGRHSTGDRGDSAKPENACDGSRRDRVVLVKRRCG
jgi:pyrroline-5-carboxylate reductase